MHMSFDFEDFKVTPYVAQTFNWLAFDDHSSNQGIYISMYFKSVEDVDTLIGYLETLKTKMESEVTA